MPKGAVVMLDALGFKGIWGRKRDRTDGEGRTGGEGRTDGEGRTEKGMEAAIERLDQIRQKAIAARDTWVEYLANLKPELAEGVVYDLEVNLSFLSDTLVVAARFPKLDRPEDEVLAASFLAGDIIGLAAQDKEFPLVFRGAVSYGQYLIRPGKEQFIVGPAIDEAAEAMELAEGALVWLTPTALRKVGDGSAGHFMYLDSVPLKGLAPYRTYVVVARDADQKLIPKETILRAFDEKPHDLRVQVKRQNTERFLDLCERMERKRERDERRERIKRKREERKRTAPDPSES